MDEIRAFISGYQLHDLARIQFKWNGKHSEEFRDENEAFRSKVFAAVIDDIAAAPIILVRDLFCAETQWAVEAWCIKEDVDVLAKNLLRRGGTIYLDDYLEGKYACFDANLGTAFGWDRTLLTTLLDEVRARLAANPSSPKADLWRQGEALFARELGGATA
jgi:hypothetical protein